MPFFYLILALLGLALGSFIGMLTHRIPRGISIFGRSVCDHCHKKIRWFNNIPVVSFILLRGKCASCGKKIGLRYPVIETLTSIAFVISTFLFFSTNNSSLSLFKTTLGFAALPALLMIIAIFISLIVIDFEFEILPDILVLVLGLTVLLFLFLAPPPTLINHISWGLISFSFFLGIFVLTRGRGMGFGDVKLSFVLGSLLGYPRVLIWFLLSFSIGAVVGLFLIAANKASWKKHIAFGPFLLLGAWISLFFSDRIVGWYNHFL
ncbi:MAG: prepilin peptidase [Candidatus Blackburnbacteria bacterium]|nr:prepilin peptidase [Candidatus Blackburnbacteria bacterium]